MKVLLSWMQEFAPDISGDPVELGEHLSELGLAVEEIETVGEGLDGIVVAKVLDLAPHPDADRIQLVQVDTGDGEPLQICCGAFNMAVGDHVPLATLGTTMGNGMEIARRKMRGEWSNGMLCSASELEMGDDHDGIMILPADVELGRDLRGALGIQADVLYDLEVNPNRPDAMSIAGVARDLAARLGVPFAIPTPDLAVDASTDATQLVKVNIIDPDLCGRFVARVLHNIDVGTSPRWMANRLLALGMRPINSVVDVSNYVMLELGQPNHTFDLAKIVGAELNVRWARDGEKITTLDEVERSLVAADGVISDGSDTAVSLAGVMGGASTEISDTTTDVLLEMAWWNPPSIARTARRLNLRSEASARFERGSDPQIPELAMLRFAQLLGETGATLGGGTIDIAGTLPEPPRVRVRTARVNAMLGTSMEASEMVGHLRSIDFETSEPDADGFDTTVPSFRPDTATEIDVIEEIARMHGYSNIVRTVPSSPLTGGLSPVQQKRRNLRNTLVGLGFAEAMPVPFLAPGDLERAGLSGDGIVVTNPLDKNESIMRSSLRPGLLKAIAFNASHRNPGVGFFEMGHVFGPVPDGESLPDERDHLAVVIAGAEAPRAVETWRLIAESLGAKYRIASSEVPGFHPTRCATISVGKSRVGTVGEIDPAVLAAYEIPERVAVVEVDLSLLFAEARGDKKYKRVSRFPSSDVDLAFVVADDVAASDVERSLRKAAGPLLSTVSLFDVYRGEGIDAGSRSLAYTLRFQADDRTLTDDEVATARQSCIDDVATATGATLR